MGDAPVVVWEIWQWVGRLQRRAEVPAIDVRLGTERTTWGCGVQKKKTGLSCARLGVARRAGADLMWLARLALNFQGLFELEGEGRRRVIDGMERMEKIGSMTGS